MRRIISLFIPMMFALIVGSVPTVKAQTTINSDGVSVRNSAPANVFFMFPVSAESNVVEIQMGCSDSGVNRNIIFVYEEQPNGQILTYPFPGEVACNEVYGGKSPNFTYMASLKNGIVVNTPDHTITITTSTAWTAANVSCGRSGYCWKATGGSSQIVVQ